MALLLLSRGSAAMSDFLDLLGSSWCYLDFTRTFWGLLKQPGSTRPGFHLWLFRVANLGGFSPMAFRVASLGGLSPMAFRVANLGGFSPMAFRVANLGGFSPMAFSGCQPGGLSPMAFSGGHPGFPLLENGFLGSHPELITVYAWGLTFLIMHKRYRGWAWKFVDRGTLMGVRPCKSKGS